MLFVNKGDAPVQNPNVQITLLFLVNLGLTPVTDKDVLVPSCFSMSDNERTRLFCTGWDFPRFDTHITLLDLELFHYCLL